MRIKIQYSLIITIMMCAFTGCTRCQSDSVPEPYYTPQEQALRRDIGEMLMIGFRGTSISHDDHIVRDIKKYHIGGVVLFAYDAPSGSWTRNIDSPSQLKRLCRHLQRVSKEPLFISIDQEGGYVNRLKEKNGFPHFASAKSMAAGGPDSVHFYARLTAQTLHDMGINLNFAPCVDVDINPDCPVIGKIERSFSADPQRVSSCARIWIDEQNKEHVISCLKHFPGHGSSDKDSHAGLVDVSQTWKSLELEPYKLLINSGKVDMIMTTHVFNTQLDSLWPATLSQKTLTGLLRDSLHFHGVIITDDLAMGAMVRQYGYADILMNAINAGADLLCLSNNGMGYNADIVPVTVDLIFQMVKEGKISADRIHQSAHRIRVLKKKIK